MVDVPPGTVSVFSAIPFAGGTVVYQAGLDKDGPSFHSFHWPPRPPVQLDVCSYQSLDPCHNNCRRRRGGVDDNFGVGRGVDVE